MKNWGRSSRQHHLRLATRHHVPLARSQSSAPPHFHSASFIRWSSRARGGPQASCTGRYRRGARFKANQQVIRVSAAIEEDRGGGRRWRARTRRLRRAGRTRCCVTRSRRADGRRPHVYCLRMQCWHIPEIPAIPESHPPVLTARVGGRRRETESLEAARRSQRERQTMR